MCRRTLGELDEALVDSCGDRTDSPLYWINRMRASPLTPRSATHSIVEGRSTVGRFPSWNAPWASPRRTTKIGAGRRQHRPGAGIRIRLHRPCRRRYRAARRGDQPERRGCTPGIARSALRAAQRGVPRGGPTRRGESRCRARGRSGTGEPGARLGGLCARGRGLGVDTRPARTRLRARMRVLPRGAGAGRGAGHAPAPGPLPPRPRQAVPPGRPPGRGPRRAVDGGRRCCARWGWRSGCRRPRRSWRRRVGSGGAGARTGRPRDVDRRRGGGYATGRGRRAAIDAPRDGSRGHGRAAERDGDVPVHGHRGQHRALGAPARGDGAPPSPATTPCSERPSVEHGGHVVKTTGDGFHAAFARAPDAVAAALDAQRRLAGRAVGRGRADPGADRRCTPARPRSATATTTGRP